MVIIARPTAAQLGRRLAHCQGEDVRFHLLTQLQLHLLNLMYYSQQSMLSNFTNLMTVAPRGLT
jgi:hypothetical protein